MQVTFNPSDLRPIIEAAVRETLAQVQTDQARLGDSMAYSEPKAAALLELEPHQLRDARRRGAIAASVITGRRIRYTRDDLLAYLAKTRVANFAKV